MSSLPGLTLEEYVAWEYDLIIQELPETNVSLGIAETLGMIPRHRTQLCQADFTPLIALFEPHRASVESLLSSFDEENQSWRGYSAGVAAAIPDEVDVKARAYLKQLAEPKPTTLELLKHARAKLAYETYTQEEFRNRLPWEHLRLGLQKQWVNVVEALDKPA